VRAARAQGAGRVGLFASEQPHTLRCTGAADEFILPLVSAKKTLQAQFIADTAVMLTNRVKERFPGSGLLAVFVELQAVASAAAPRAESLTRPLLPLRICVWLLGTLLLVGLVYALNQARLDTPASASLSDLLQAADAAVNLVVLLGAAILSLWKLEESLKRRDALALVHRLRELAHIIDMHQLTKDPEAIVSRPAQTASSPQRTMTQAELGRYLDYCSEGLALLGKVAAVYAQKVQDPVVLDAVDGIEDLTTGLSRKIWQKIAILHATRPGKAQEHAAL